MASPWEIILSMIEDPECASCPNKGVNGLCALTIPDDEDS